MKGQARREAQQKAMEREQAMRAAVTADDAPQTCPHDGAALLRTERLADFGTRRVRFVFVCGHSHWSAMDRVVQTPFGPTCHKCGASISAPLRICDDCLVTPRQKGERRHDRQALVPDRLRPA